MADASLLIKIELETRGVCDLSNVLVKKPVNVGLERLEILYFEMGGEEHFTESNL
jgi:hypothetical protein